MYCCIDAVITKFVQDRLRLSNDDQELGGFYPMVVYMNDKDLLKLCKNQYGNYIT